MRFTPGPAAPFLRCRYFMIWSNAGLVNGDAEIGTLSLVEDLMFQTISRVNLGNVKCLLVVFNIKCPKGSKPVH